MTITRSILRLLILIVLGILAMIGIFSEPLADSPNWYTDVLLSKILGVLSAWSFGRLLARWSDDPLIRTLMGPGIR